LDADLLSPYDYYQYWINCDDRDVEKLLKIFTFLPLDEIIRLTALQGEELREAKRILAYEATTITHGEVEAQAAEKASQAAFGSGADLAAMPTTSIDQIRLTDGIGILEIFTEIGLTKSNGDARRMLKQGGIYVNDNRVNEVNAELTPVDVTPNGILLRAGKKKYHRLVVE
jgi:tyrosyl-tRNA synthetase